jgi:pimeloyl-ACP methyl ester carboxylesterase
MPTIRGAGDKTPMSVTNEHLAAMPGSRKVQIENALHATPVEQSGAFNRHVLEFLEELDP